MSLSETLDKIMKLAGDLEPISAEEYLQFQVDGYNSNAGTLDLIDCPKCLNRGDYAVAEDGHFVIKECSCMTKRRAMRRMKRSGLEDVISRYTFASYQAQEDWQKQAKELCERYTREPNGWLVISGNSGTGKTHLCTAVCGALIKQGKDVRYFLWRTQAPTLKALANSVDYESAVRPWKEVKVLYIDDFLKGTITDADINLAFDLLNARYNRTDLITIISSEQTIEDILSRDEALGSRIYERLGVYIKTVGKKNWRLS